MPTDPSVNPASAASTTVSAIENELPAYRAISPLAVVALILGVLSVLSFASWYFLTLAVAGVLLGYLADRKILAFPDTLTGRGMAQAGVGLGLIFGLTAVTVTTVHGVLRVRQAKEFARTYEEVLNKGSLPVALWYGQSPEVRATLKAEELFNQMTAPGPNLMSFEEHHGGLRDLMKALAEPKAALHFSRVENHGEQELTQFVGIVYEVHTPEAADQAQREREALIVFKGEPQRKGGYGWWASEVIFPYKSKTFVAPAPTKKPGDDGHGHSH